MKSGKLIKEKSLKATMLMIAVLTVLFIVTYYRINVLIQNAASDVWRRA